MASQRFQIQLWHASASPDAAGPVEQLCQRYLDDKDRQRADRFRRPTSRNQHVVGRGMARRLIGGTAADPRSLPYRDAPGGKPRLFAGTKQLADFNVSHTEGLVVCGLTAQDPPVPMIGVDVERIDRKVDVQLAERYFSPPEIRWLDSIPAALDKQEGFLRLWTLKEAFIKAIGTGLRTPLDQFAIVDADSQTPSLQFLDDALESDAVATFREQVNPDVELSPNHRWRLRQIVPRDGFFAAVAACVPADAELHVELRDFDELATA